MALDFGISRQRLAGKGTTISAVRMTRAKMAVFIVLFLDNLIGRDSGVRRRAY
jgi:hypothetical protein